MTTASMFLILTSLLLSHLIENLLCQQPYS